MVDPVSVFIGTGTSYHGNQRILLGCVLPENAGNSGHGLIAAHGTEHTGKVLRSHTGLSKIMATWIPASPAIDSGQYVFHLVNPGILDHFEALRNQEQYYGCHNSCGTQC